MVVITRVRKANVSEKKCTNESGLGAGTANCDPPPVASLGESYPGSATVKRGDTEIIIKDDGGSLLLEAGAMIAIIFALAAAIVLVLWARHKFRK